MLWNWQQKDWPNFKAKPSQLTALEEEFLFQSGHLYGIYAHVEEAERIELLVELMSQEALKSSEIEGEVLHRMSLQSSIRRHFGLQYDSDRIAPAEQGMANMMIDLYQSYAQELSHDMLFNWHHQIMMARSDISDIACYRCCDEPMQVVSGLGHQPNIHFEAPPSSRMVTEMDQFISWFNNSAPQGASPLSPLHRAGLAHLYFVSIHPFEDGNGRIARALSEKVLAQHLHQPTLIALSQSIEKNKKEYYVQLENNNKNMHVSEWFMYFAQTILTANVHSQGLIAFLIEKTRFYERFQGQLNARQEKVIHRLFQAGPEGFNGGLSAKNYMSITKTSRATTTRDLQQLYDMGILTRTGTRKITRYRLNVNTK